VLAGAIGVSALVMASAEAFTLLKLAGALYLVWLGLKTMHEARTPLPSDVPRVGNIRAFRDGILVEALNPKTAAFFLAFLPQFVDPDRGSVVVQSLILGTLFTTLAILGDGAYVLAADAISGRLRGGRGMRRLARVSGGVYIGLGVTAALSGSGHARGGGA
jgi:threonine/homoserine/homoserine lactone efflux protein